MERALLKVRGIVQGVGFRPFVHRLVGRFSLSGYIINCSSGVEIELEGEREAIIAFSEALKTQAPRLAVIEAVEVSFADELRHYSTFEIKKSRREDERNTLISPDIAICDDCLRELRDERDRRYRYPFINCTNCGPRFSIIKDVPYDRPNTSMKAFPMCGDCEAEYKDIENRRYHAQPDCCAECGPRVYFLNDKTEEVKGDAFSTAREYIKNNKIIAVKGLGGMHLACNCDENTVNTLRERKQRDKKPLALMCRDIEAVYKICYLSEDEKRILESYSRPIVLLKKRSVGFEHISENGFIGVMLPYTPLHYLLMEEGIDMLVMTSANLSDCPIMYKNEEALECLNSIADGFLLHNRDIQTRCDDSLCWVLDGREYFARRSRGYVPYPLTMHRALKPVLACGAEQKASFCLSKGEHIFPSQHIGDLKNYETLENYEAQIEHFKSLFDILPEAVASDMHPDYFSTAYAEENAEDNNLPFLQIQHHHAHMAACMADNALEGDVIALVWDGTGYGMDGTIWGAECLMGTYGHFERFASIVPLSLIGGDRASRELARIGFFLQKAAQIPTSDIDNANEYDIILTNNFNSPKCSSMGRLFDGVAYLLGICKVASYEGEGAVLLEASAKADENGSYPFTFTNELMRFDWREMVKAIYKDKINNVSTAVCAAKFMNTLCKMAVEQCKAARIKSGLSRVCLSGGSFQNMYIMHRLPAMLKAEGFEVYCHHRVACNDEGISLGQLMVADAVLTTGDKNVFSSTT